MSKTTEHYEWREFVNGDLCTPDVGDGPFDYSFDTIQKALKTKRGHYPEQEWALVKVTTKIVCDSVCTTD